ncbi:aminoglycoside phosphotransferase family protein [Candidatus Methylocalor cossyra]|uniref:N-acetylmuramate/N-acetylglucosamine kinase n=1 Tax=Candidatus Methylocalor cossyra TaxID=3108543 RepID=A0ABP1C8P3_9GAMM
MPPDQRLAALLAWLRQVLGQPLDGLEPASSDASFRRYFRAWRDGRSFIAMDAPPPREDLRTFLSVAALLRSVGLRTPEVYAADEENGFALLSDFGTRRYLDCLDDQSAGQLYGDALAALMKLQSGLDPAASGLPGYGERLLWSELETFREWFLGRWLGLELEAREARLLDQTWRLLIESALEQPRVCVHRDYHSRNLMVIGQGNPGVLDFQDAVVGPLTYDLVSLLRDCYVGWPAAWVDAWLDGYRTALREAGLLDDRGVERFRRWFDLMGMQRHLKAAGLFARLRLRDGKPGYLKDIPRTLRYVLEAGAGYASLAPFLDFLDRRVMPRLLEAGGR